MARIFRDGNVRWLHVPPGSQAPEIREMSLVYKNYTPLKMNMEPKNEGLEDDFPFETGDFQVPC